MPKERRELIDGIPIVRMDRIPDSPPSLLFEWELTDKRHRPLRVSGARLCEHCGMKNPCSWCNMALEHNLDDT